MGKKKVVVMGATGMLGAMVVEVFAREAAIELVPTRRKSDLPLLAPRELTWCDLDASVCSIDQCRQIISGAEWVINCIGITKPFINDVDSTAIERAIRVNALFPYLLAEAAAAENVQVLQIATDCVFSGAHGKYAEDSPHDALDVYGKTKSLAEARAPVMHHLRASIVGPEPKDRKFLLEWFLGQSNGSVVNGFTNHDWNGVTTLHFARVALGIVTHGVVLPHVHHLVPRSHLSKANLLATFATAYHRSDLKINRLETTTAINRTLRTMNEELNRRLWSLAGYNKAPSVEEMIFELAQYRLNEGRTVAA